MLMTMDQPRLHLSQQRAIEHMQSVALGLQLEALEMINHVLYMGNCLPAETVRAAVLSSIRRTARVALHFHPDRPGGKSEDGGSAKTVTACLLDDGVYRSQFETGISNGGLSAHPGGARDEWERSLFGGAYHGDGYNSEDDTGDSRGSWRTLRPTYGALDVLGSASDGPAPRFGSCFLVLKPEVLARCTFTLGGSADKPKWQGTMEEFDGVLAGMLEESFMRESTLGAVGEMRPPKLVAHILARGEGDGISERARSGNLDFYAEAQVHGQVLLDRDVEGLVADPSFRDGQTGRDLVALAEKFGFGLRWHVGSEIRVEDVPSNFRGPTVPSLAARIASDGMLNAKVIGDAVRQLTKDAAAWSDRGPPAHVMQELKWLWHVLVRFGKPYKSGHLSN